MDSIQIQRKKIKIIKKSDYDQILPYEFIEDRYDKYKLRDVYNLVFYEKDSKYITKIIKPMKIDSSLISSIRKNGIFNISEKNLQSQNINIWDEIIFVDNLFTTIHLPNIYKITDIEKERTGVNVKIEIEDVINISKSQEILKVLKEA